MRAFRQDRQVKASAEINDRTDDRHRVVIVFQVADKATVDLDLVEAERLQIRQGRISRPEIVHCNPHAERLEPTED